MNLYRPKHISPLVLLLLLLSACLKTDSEQEQALGIAVLKAELEVGQAVSDISFETLKGLHPSEAISGLTVRLSSDEQSTQLMEDPSHPGHYYGPDNFIIEALKNYTLSTSYDESSLSAVTSTPPVMGSLASTKDYIDSEITGDLVDLEWSGINSGSFNEYFYVLEIITLDPSAEQIDRFEVGETQTTYIRTRVPEVTLSINDFNFYGPHNIKVHAVNLDMEALFTQQSDLSQSGYSNVQGGYGYLIGTSTVQGAIEIR